MHDYNLSLLQRGVKILGTYAYQHVARHNDVYLKYIPVAIEKIKQASGLFREWNEILKEVIA